MLRIIYKKLGVHEMTPKEMAERIRRIEGRLFGADYVALTDAEFQGQPESEKAETPDPAKKESK